MEQFNWYVKCLKQYTDFNGRARRSELWYFVLFNFVAGLVLGLVAWLLGTNLLSNIYSLAVFIPSIAVWVRRMHDIGKSGWWVLLCLVPLVNLYLIYLGCLDSQPGANQWGNNPKEA